MTSVDLKSLVSSSWKTCAYFCNTDSIICFSSGVNGLISLRNVYYTALLFFDFSWASQVSLNWSVLACFCLLTPLKPPPLPQYCGLE
jgi:hypothetical protein